MRVSTDKSDPGYPTFQHLFAGAEKIIVLLDGTEIDEVETADEEAGVLVRYRSGENGELILTPSRDEIERETLTGKVEIRVIPRT